MFYFFHGEKLVVLHDSTFKNVLKSGLMFAAEQLLGGLCFYYKQFEIILIESEIELPVALNPDCSGSLLSLMCIKNPQLNSLSELVFFFWFFFGE